MKAVGCISAVYGILAETRHRPATVLIRIEGQEPSMGRNLAGWPLMGMYAAIGCTFILDGRDLGCLGVTVRFANSGG